VRDIPVETRDYRLVDGHAKRERIDGALVEDHVESLKICNEVSEGYGR